MSVEGSKVRDLDDEAALTSGEKVVVETDGVPDSEEVSRVGSRCTAPIDSGNGLGLITGVTLGLQSFLVGGAGLMGCFKVLEVCGLGSCGAWAFG